MSWLFLHLFYTTYLRRLFTCEFFLFSSIHTSSTFLPIFKNLSCFRENLIYTVYLKRIFICELFFHHTSHKKHNISKTIFFRKFSQTPPRGGGWMVLEMALLAKNDICAKCAKYAECVLCAIWIAHFLYLEINLYIEVSLFSDWSETVTWIIRPSKGEWLATTSSSVIRTLACVIASLITLISTVHYYLCYNKYVLQETSNDYFIAGKLVSMS